MTAPTSSPSGSNAARTSSNAVHGGMEITLTIVIFFLLGLAIDSWLGTGPWISIGLFLFAAVASGLRLYFTYTYQMEQLEAERAQRSER